VLPKSKDPYRAKILRARFSECPILFTLPSVGKKGATNPLDPLFVNPAEIDPRDPRLLFAFDFLCVSVPLW
jgi:hypothetical protein